MRHWLQARAEEDKRRQEEERTRQESLRLEQRKVEMDMLRTSLSGGIPPAMVPLVFTGMGSGVLPQAALEWAQQFMPTTQAPRPQLLPPSGPVSPEHQREAQAHAQAQAQAHAQAQAQAHGQYHGIPPSAPPAQAPGTYAYPAPGSPTRPRAQTVTGVVGRPGGVGPNIPSLNATAHGGAPGMPSHPHVPPGQPPQHETQASPSIYFHHWQPPSQASGSSNRPGSPSGSFKNKRKRDSP